MRAGAWAAARARGGRSPLRPPGRSRPRGRSGEGAGEGGIEPCAAAVSTRRQAAILTVAPACDGTTAGGVGAD